MQERFQATFDRVLSWNETTKYWESHQSGEAMQTFYTDFIAAMCPGIGSLLERESPPDVHELLSMSWASEPGIGVYAAILHSHDDSEVARLYVGSTARAPAYRGGPYGLHVRRRQHETALRSPEAGSYVFLAVEPELTAQRDQSIL